MAQAKSSIFIGECPFCKAEITGSVKRFLTVLGKVKDELPDIICGGEALPVPVIDCSEFCATEHKCSSIGSIRTVIFINIRAGKFAGFNAVNLR